MGKLYVNCFYKVNRSRKAEFNTSRKKFQHNEIDFSPLLPREKRIREARKISKMNVVSLIALQALAEKRRRNKMRELRRNATMAFHWSKG